jgi:tetratricopeptide (TPR) repeat protein
VAARHTGPDETNRNAQEVDVPKLVIFRGDAVENEIRLSGSTIRIGRHNRNDVVLDDALNGVSRFHAEIRLEAGTYVIADLNSRNGVWINGRRIKEKAALALGVPVTVGAFELALEDDASSGQFDVPLVNQQTVVSAASVAGKDRPSGSGTRSRSMRAPLAANRRQMLLWSGAAAIVLLICAIPFFVIRSKNRPPPPPVAIAPTTVVTPEPPPAQAPPEDPNKKVIEQHLADARTQMGAGDYVGAVRDHLQSVLELEPENADALELKRQADEAAAAAAAAAAATQEKKTRVVAKSDTAAEVETPGIPRRSNEPYAEYMGRVRRIQVALNEGKSAADKGDFIGAIGHFRSVERDQPRYQGVDLLMTETLAKQQKAVEDATNSGQQNEQAGKLKEARLWYQRALEIDPNATSAREKNATLLARMTSDATKLFDQATLAMKLQDTARAIRLYQQIVDAMLPGDEIRERAAKQMELLKR